MKYFFSFILGIISLHMGYSQSLSFSVNGIDFKMVYVKGGTFQMGSNDWDSFSDERPVHTVTLKSFYIGVTEVTQALWEAVMGYNPSKKKNPNYPVDCVSWNECQLFIKEICRITKKRFRLPTEAEWEYAARGGNYKNKYSGSNVVGMIAFMDDNSASTPHIVAQKRSNEFGIHDMTGNVWEWCSDWYAEKYSNSKNATNPKGPSNGTEHIVRGGSWNCIPRVCRVTNRFKCAPDGYRDDLGLRLVLEISSK